MTGAPSNEERRGYFQTRWSKVMVIEGDAYAVARALSAIVVELLKQMDGAKRLALIDRAAEALEKGPNPGGQSTAAAIKILRDQFTKM